MQSCTKVGRSRCCFRPSSRNCDIESACPILVDPPHQQSCPVASRRCSTGSMFEFFFSQFFGFPNSLFLSQFFDPISLSQFSVAIHLRNKNVQIHQTQNRSVNDWTTRQNRFFNYCYEILLYAAIGYPFLTKWTNRVR